MTEMMVVVVVVKWKELSRLALAIVSATLKKRALDPLLSISATPLLLGMG